MQLLHRLSNSFQALGWARWCDCTGTGHDGPECHAPVQRDIAFLCWAYLPESLLREGLGVAYYYPISKYWALALPAWGLVAFLCSGLGYVAINLMATAPLTSTDTGPACAHSLWRLPRR